MADIYFYNIIIPRIVISPDARENDIARENLPGMHQKEFEKIKFARRQIDWLPVKSHRVNTAIQLDILKGQCIRKIIAMPAENGARARNQLAKGEWLG